MISRFALTLLLMQHYAASCINVRCRVRGTHLWIEGCDWSGTRLGHLEQLRRLSVSELLRTLCDDQ